MRAPSHHRQETVQTSARTRYFAYGGNIIAPDMAVRCPEAREIGVATLPGWRFSIMRRGYATILPDPGALVLGVLWSITARCQQALDDFEDIGGGLYHHATLEIEGAPTLIYLASDIAPGEARTGYLAAIIAEAETRGFPADYVADVRRWLSPA
jgi:hypothetical protein